MKITKKTKNKILEFVVLSIMLIGVLLYDYVINPVKKEESNEVKETVELVKCIDGDTAKIMYNNEKVNIRFLAINTKEIGNKEEEYGKEASEYTCSRLKNAKKIEIEFDSESDKYDKYDRLLGWVFVDDKLLQLDLVEEGYAEIKYIYGDYKYLDELKKKEQYAKDNKLGIWGL